MKALYTLAAALIITSTTFAQSSRRSETRDNNSQEDKSVSTRSSRTSSSDNSSRRGETTTSSNRSSNGEATERRQETNSNNQVSQPSSTRSSGNSSRTSTQEPSRSVSQQPASTSRTYDNNRRDGYNDRREVVVQDHSRRTVEPRHHTVVHKSYRPVPVEVRRVKSPYRAPVRAEVIWTVDLSRRFEVYYPAYRPMRYHVGMRLPSVSAYDAYDFVGEIARVYGRVAETYFAWETDEYFLYLGDYYPYHDFTVVIPGREARDFSRRPERYFDNQYIEVTGLVSRFEGKPEMVIKHSTQVGVY